jgi:type I restriction enzyme R subunit
MDTYGDLSEEERERWEEQDWGDEEEMPDEIGAEAINRWLFNADTVDKVLETLMTRGHRVASGDRLGKTIVFAKNSAHAEFITERFDANYPEHAGHFARAITFRTEYAQSLIDDFSVKERAPHIAMSVDMLDTGIDVPEVVNLVFFKRVRSKTKFWQMIGRGTRLCPDLFGPGEHKRDFFVFDCCENVAFFNQDGASGDRGLRDDTVALLHGQVRGMNPDNFLVRPHRRWVERYAEPEAWHGLDAEQAKEIAEHLADLPTTARDDDEAAKRFDLIVLGLQLRRLRPEPGEERLRRQVQEIAAGLLEQTAIPAIRGQQELLDELAGDEWWVDVSPTMLEGARRRVRGLVRLLERRKRAIVYTDFTDELGGVDEIGLGDWLVSTDLERFREKARAYLREHEDHVALQKLRRNRPLTGSDLAELERMLVEAGIGDGADFARAREEAKGLGSFIRSLVGLERSAASDAFAAFIADRTLNADQLHFVNLVIEHLTENGLMDPGLLYESPFTDVVPQGPEGIFPEEDVSELVATIDGVRANAEPRDAAA